MMKRNLCSQNSSSFTFSSINMDYEASVISTRSAFWDNEMEVCIELAEICASQ
jgi:hypothetical protein